MKLKLTTVFCCLFLLCTIANAQYSMHDKKSKIGITYAFLGSTDLDINRGLDGGPGYSSEDLLTIGVNYVKPITHWLDIETGLEYSTQTVIARYHHPDVTPQRSESDLTLINIPVSLRANFLGYFFFNTGVFLDIDASESSTIDEQSGIGALAGLGTSYNFNSNFSAFLNPYIKYHSLIPLAGQEQNIWEAGVRVGVMVQLN